MFWGKPGPSDDSMCAHTPEMDRISVIVGLGNPGEFYERTRHNIGFQVVDRLALQSHVALQERRFCASWEKGEIEGKEVLLIKPLTCMNRSGEVVQEMLGAFGLSPTQMMVVHDDLDLLLGRIKLAQRGGAGGHRGILSIIERVGTQDFARLKLGIGRPLQGESIEAFVLAPPYPEQATVFEEMITCGVEATQSVLSFGLHESMARFNRRVPHVGED